MSRKSEEMEFGKRLQCLGPASFSRCLKPVLSDPAKVTRSALQNAASIAAMLLTTECLVAEFRKKRKNQMPGGMPPMDRMYASAYLKETAICLKGQMAVSLWQRKVGEKTVVAKDSSVGEKNRRPKF